MHKPTAQSAASGSVDQAAVAGSTDRATGPLAVGIPAVGIPGVGHIVQIDDDALDESSGLAVSGRVAHRIWSHNDSGGRPRLYAYDTRTGQRTGRCELSRLTAVDWEDIALRQLNVGDPAIRRSLLVVADCGDNLRKRRSIQLHLFAEPDPDRTSKLSPTDVRTIDVRFPEGPQDCEGVAFDFSGRQILLVTKTQWKRANVYAVPLPTQGIQSAADQPTVTATRITQVAVPMVTGIDLDPGTGDFWMTSYWGAYRFARQSPDQTLADQLATTPPITPLPPWRQIEAIASAGDDRAWVSTEGAPAKLGLIGAAK